MSQEYRCGTCGSPELRAWSDADTPDRWRLACGAGHELIPVPGSEYDAYGFTFVATLAHFDRVVQVS